MAIELHMLSCGYCHVAYVVTVPKHFKLLDDYKLKNSAKLLDDQKLVYILLDDCKTMPNCQYILLDDCKVYIMLDGCKLVCQTKKQCQNFTKCVDGCKLVCRTEKQCQKRSHELVLIFFVCQSFDTTKTVPKLVSKQCLLQLIFFSYIHTLQFILQFVYSFSCIHILQFIYSFSCIHILYVILGICSKVPKQFILQFVYSSSSSNSYSSGIHTLVLITSVNYEIVNLLLFCS